MSVNEMKSLTVNGTKYDSFPDQTARSAAAAKLPSPATAKVGDYLVVEEVDAEGKITKVKTAEAPGGGSDSGQNGDGLTSTEKSLLLSLFKNTAYTADMSATITRLETLWSGGDIPDIPDVPVEPDIPDADVSQTGSILSIVSGVTATQNGNVLAIA
jgi:hypothetical protein